MKKAITRKPAKSFAEGLTTSKLGKADYDKMLEQHDAYVKTLENLGVEVTVLEAEEQFPDAHFVEDTAIVTDKMAVITIPGAESRQGEQFAIEEELKKHRELEYIAEPGTVDGGDIMQIKDTFFIGQSDRTNEEGAKQLAIILERYGFKSIVVQVKSGLHLKSSVNYIGDNILVMTKEFSEIQEFHGFNKLILSDEESYAANCLLVNDSLIMPKGYNGLKTEFQKVGFQLIELDMSEVQKMDGGLTCLSLRFE